LDPVAISGRGVVPPAAGYSMSEMAYQTILTRVIDGIYPVNSKLPSEHDLAGELKVSRPVLRAALVRLKVDGVLVSRQGSGNFVIRQPHPSVLLFASLARVSDIQDCFKFRVGLEGEAAFHAALNRDEAQLRDIRQAFADLDHIVGAKALGVDADFAFHLAVARASGNPYFVAALEAIRDDVAYGMSLTRQLSLRRSGPRLALVQKEHGAIVEAIAAGRGETARVAMRDHLEAARRRVFEGDLVERP
jgi:DNA-binding FadR family transcriptional regulator